MEGEITERGWEDGLGQGDAFDDSSPHGYRVVSLVEGT